MLELVFLGVNGSVQERESGNVSLIVSDGKYSVLVDASVNLQEAVNRQVDAIILTHEHIDHIYGLPSFLHQSWLVGRTKPLTIYADEKFLPKAKALVDFFGLREKKGMFEINFESLSSGFGFGGSCSDGSCSDGLEVSALEISALEISAFRTDHTDCSIGLVFKCGDKKVVYTCDTLPITSPPSSWNGADILIHEATDVKESLHGKHSSGYDAGVLATKIGAKRLMLCHLPCDSDGVGGLGGKQAVLLEAKAAFAGAEIPVVMESYYL